MSNTPRCYFDPSKDGKWRGCRLDPKKIEARTFTADFYTRNFLGRVGVSRYAANPLIIALSPGYSDKYRFHPWPPNAPDRKSFGSRRKNSKRCSDDWHRWRFWHAFKYFGTHYAESYRMNKSSWLMDPNSAREMPSCSAIDLTEIRPSSKIISWICSIISGTFIVSFRPGRGPTQVEKLPRLNCATQFLTVAFDGACSPNFSIRMA